jgi:hypothetical protein
VETQVVAHTKQIADLAEAPLGASLSMDPLSLGAMDEPASVIVSTC